MSSTVSLPVAARGSASTLRSLGLIGMLFAPGILVEVSVRQLLSLPNDPPSAISSVLGLLYIVGWMGSMVGFRMMRLTGNGLAARIIFPIQMLGLGLASCQQLIELSGSQTLRNSMFFGICDAAWPLSHLFMLVVGGMVLATGRVHGAWRFAALGCGLALPLGFAARTVSYGIFLDTFGVLTTLCFGVVAWTVCRAGSGREI